MSFVSNQAGSLNTVKNVVMFLEKMHAGETVNTAFLSCLYFVAKKRLCKWERALVDIIVVLLLSE